MSWIVLGQVKDQPKACKTISQKQCSSLLSYEMELLRFCNSRKLLFFFAENCLRCFLVGITYMYKTKISKPWCQCHQVWSSIERTDIWRRYKIVLVFSHVFIDGWVMGWNQQSSNGARKIGINVDVQCKAMRVMECLIPGGKVVSLVYH